jgi:glycerophosphoryl diester phosphodiesterase
MNDPLVIAHRGYSARYTENTQLAYLGAIDIGADIVESDARLSSDGFVYACHDATLGRIAGDARGVADMTAAELQDVRLPTGERLSPLPRTLTDIAPLRPVLIDVKTPDLPLIEAVARDIRSCGALDKVWIGVRDLAQMKLAHALLPGVRLLAFLPDYALAEEFARAGAQAFRVWEGHLDQPAALRVVREKPTWITLGGKSTSFEVGDTTPDRLARVLALGPRGVLLNDPALMTGPAAPARTTEAT